MSANYRHKANATLKASIPDTFDTYGVNLSSSTLGAMFLWPQEGDPAKPLRDLLPKSTFPAVPPGNLSQEVLTSLITQVSKWVFEEFEESRSEERLGKECW